LEIGSMYRPLIVFNALSSLNLVLTNKVGSSHLTNW
jgi:hypothetical protein